LISDLYKNVDWEDEEKCLNSISKSLASFYSLENCQELPHDELKQMIEFKIFDLLRSSFYVPSKNNIECDSSTAVLATLPQLYKIFERC
jgi:hypothetical protein